MSGFIEEDLKDIKETVHEIEQKKQKLNKSPEEIDKELELLKSRFDRKLITRKVYEERIKELIN